MNDWPTHADGSSKTVGEMTPDERAAVLARAKERDRRRMAGETEEATS